MIQLLRNIKYYAHDDIPRIEYAVEKRGSTIYHGASAHFGVIFQLHGSIWPQVLPCCAFNTLFTALLVFLHRIKCFELDFSFDDNRHEFVSLLVSFFPIARHAFCRMHSVG